MKAFIMEDPFGLRVIAFVAGLLQITFSILYLARVIVTQPEVRDQFTAVWNIIFGVVVCIIEGKESWLDACCNIQSRVFHWAFFLATLVGRAVFYLYVGTMSLLTLPYIDDFWWFCNLVLGFTFVLIAVFQVSWYYIGPICGCTAYREQCDDAAAMRGGGPSTIGAAQEQPGAPPQFS
eukprot:5973158-Amphidinium_carterae.1